MTGRLVQPLPGRYKEVFEFQVMTRVLIIGQGLFCDALTRLLSDSPGVQIIGSVSTCAEAQARLIQEHPDVIIIDHANASVNPAELDRLLESVESLKVISLTLSENKMIIWNRQQLDDVTLPVLMQALQVSNPWNSPEEPAG